MIKLTKPLRSQQPLVRLRVTNLEWDGDHDALAAGFRVTLECGHTFWRPTNILCMRGIAKSLKEYGAACKHGCKQPNATGSPTGAAKQEDATHD